MRSGTRLGLGALPLLCGGFSQLSEEICLCSVADLAPLVGKIRRRVDLNCVQQNGLRLLDDLGDDLRLLVLHDAKAFV